MALGLFICLSVPGFLRDRQFCSPHSRGAEGVREAREHSCRNQAVPGSGPWEEQSAHPRGSALPSPLLSEWTGGCTGAMG